MNWNEHARLRAQILKDINDYPWDDSFDGGRRGDDAGRATEQTKTTGYHMTPAAKAERSRRGVTRIEKGGLIQKWAPPSHS